MDETSASVPATTNGFAWRLWRAPKVFKGKAVALGRDHASWYLVFPEPEGPTLTRAVMCLNFIVPGDATTVSAGPRGTGRPRFTIGGTQGGEVVGALWDLCRAAGRGPVEIVTTKGCLATMADPMRISAFADVMVSEDELIHVCARCGRWEATSRPRFQRCGTCKSTYYCSRECQKDDWQPGLHKDDCALLSEGKIYAVECRRRLHDNGWWLNHGVLGPVNLAGIDERKRATDEGDEDALTYGRRIPPRNVNTALVHSGLDSERTARNNRASRYISPITGKPLSGSNFCSTIVRVASLKSHLEPLELDDIPALPPLPETPGFTPTGDPEVDGKLLKRRVQNNLPIRERKALRLLLTKRKDAVSVRHTIRGMREKLEEEALRVARRRGLTAGSGRTRPMPVISDSSANDSWYSEFDHEEEYRDSESE